MESLLNRLSEKIIHFLDPEKQCDKIKRLQMHFALETILYNLLLAFFILWIFYFIGSFRETFLLFCIFGLLRIIAGGFHFDHMLKCISATTFILVGGRKAAQAIQIDPTVCLMICLFTNLLFFIHIPRGTANNPYSKAYSRLQKKRLRTLSVLLTLCAIYFVRLRTILLFAMFAAAVLLIPGLYLQSSKFICSYFSKNTLALQSYINLKRNKP
ncbi:MAG: accessory gene regulator B family protein [Eubacterium sp.]|nr:accessory gene regulator B family protein [Eubacterium sp.]